MNKEKNNDDQSGGIFEKLLRIHFFKKVVSFYFLNKFVTIMEKEERSPVCEL